MKKLFVIAAITVASFSYFAQGATSAVAAAKLKHEQAIAQATGE
ncbi:MULTISPECIES: hypothetical protein [Iodobacter]|uniref:Uncharacterized protein n=1 Tax=Iodobacter fluviatilis TaxID=537 RepID=A0A377Q844_9NEIS|nr:MULTISPECIES: hypothetical protein [Iodobacter]TCU84555.1 hypothetical protein EV682_10980 [Iodobacter fluviatilis]STQ90021.1 Uncharacterised protein [Iodobacter fluviatilis]